MDYNFWLTEAFQKAELANLRQTDLDKYENSLKIYRDLKGVIDTAFDEGRLEGKEEGRLEGKFEGQIEIARAAKKMGLSISDISKLTGLSEGEISRI